MFKSESLLPMHTSIRRDMDIYIQANVYGFGHV